MSSLYRPFTPPNFRTNRLITFACFGTCGTIFLGWNYAQRGLTYSLTSSAVDTLQSASLLPRSVKLPSPERVRSFLETHTIHRVGLSKPYSSTSTSDIASFFLANFSHISPTHLLFNTLAWSSFAQFFAHLPPTHYLSLIFGSAIASGLLFQYDHRNSSTPRAGLGASGIVSGLAMATTMLAPNMRAGFLFLPVSMPLWVLTGAFFVVDTYFMQKETQTGIGHSAHIGGALWGALYYALAMRKFGGVLGPRYR